MRDVEKLERYANLSKEILNNENDKTNYQECKDIISFVFKNKLEKSQRSTQYAKNTTRTSD